MVTPSAGQSGVRNGGRSTEGRPAVDGQHATSVDNFRTHPLLRDHLLVAVLVGPLPADHFVARGWEPYQPPDRFLAVPVCGAISADAFRASRKERSGGSRRTRCPPGSSLGSGHTRRTPARPASRREPAQSRRLAPGMHAPRGSSASIHERAAERLELNRVRGTAGGPASSDLSPSGGASPDLVASPRAPM